MVEREGLVQGSIKSALSPSNDKNGFEEFFVIPVEVHFSWCLLNLRNLRFQMSSVETIKRSFREFYQDFCFHSVIQFGDIEFLAVFRNELNILQKIYRFQERPTFLSRFKVRVEEFLEDDR